MSSRSATRETFHGPHDSAPAWPSPVPNEAERGRMLREACEAAGVELAAKDRDVVDWLAGWDYGTVRVVVDLIRRAGAR